MLITFRCYYENGQKTDHARHDLEITDVPKWLKAYQYTHPGVQSITTKIWFHQEETKKEQQSGG